MKNLNIILLFILITLVSCQDESLDPLLINELKSGQSLALRETSFANLSESDEHFGGIDTFNVNQDNSTKVIEITVDFVSADPSLLESVDTYVAKKDSDGDITEQVLVKSTPASDFASASGTNFIRGTISLNHNDLFNATGLTLCDFKPSSESKTFNIELRNDLKLTDGTSVDADLFEGSTLSESTIFFPAHILTYTAVGPYVNSTLIRLDSSGQNIDTDLRNIEKRGFESVRGGGDVTFSWTVEDNVNVEGETLSGTGFVLNDVLINTSTSSQIVVYQFTSQLENGCEGVSFDLSYFVPAPK